MTDELFARLIMASNHFDVRFDNGWSVHVNNDRNWGCYTLFISHMSGGMEHEFENLMYEQVRAALHEVSTLEWGIPLPAASILVQRTIDASAVAYERPTGSMHGKPSGNWGGVEERYSEGTPTRKIVPIDKKLRDKIKI